MVNGFQTSSAKEVETNKAGEFEIPPYTPLSLLPIISNIRGPLFTIFKPGYGSVNGMALGGYLIGEEQEVQDFELSGRRYRYALGVIELPKLKTREERLRSRPGGPTDIGIDKLPIFYKLINEDRRNLGLKGDVWR